MAAPQSNNGHSHQSVLDAALWPESRLGEAVHALARAAGLPTTCSETFAPPPDPTPEQFSAWMEAAADRGGIQANQVVAGLDEIATLTRRGAPLLLRMRVSDTDRFLAVLGGHGRRVSVLGPDLRCRRILVATLCEEIQRPFERPVEAEIDRLLDPDAYRWSPAGARTDRAAGRTA